MKIISGPTGVGKTEFALQLSDRIFNADPFQFYREIPILSNQPNLKKNEKVEFLADRSIANPLNAGEFGRLAETHLNEPGIWVGTGLYLGAAIYGLDPDRKKGTPFQGRPRREFRMIVLDQNRARLYERLNTRVDEMMKKGALDEAASVSKMIDSGEVSTKNPVLKTIGLKHLLQYLRKECSKEEAVEVWKRDTRRLAKRQWTWLRKFCAPGEKIRWVNVETADSESMREFLDQ